MAVILNGNPLNYNLKTVVLSKTLNEGVQFEPLELGFYDTYIEIGTRAYNEHYRHLWPNGDTTTYIQNSFTHEVLLKEEQDLDTALYLIKSDHTYVGILKITLHKEILEYRNHQALYLDKIYILKEFSRKGIGKKCLQFVGNIATKLSKKVVFLESMQKGKALPFYLANKFSIVDNTKVPFENVIEEEKPMYLLMKKI